MTKVKGRKGRWVAAAVAAAVLATGVGSAPTFAAADPAMTVWKAGGSNMGECSAYLGQLQVRSDVNHLIKQYGDVLGVANPGELFRDRAQQAVNLPPQQECLQRSF